MKGGGGKRGMKRRGSEESKDEEKVKHRDKNGMSREKERERRRVIGNESRLIDSQQTTADWYHN